MLSSRVECEGFRRTVSKGQREREEARRLLEGKPARQRTVAARSERAGSSWSALVMWGRLLASTPP